MRIRITIDMEPGGRRLTKITAATVEARDEANQRLQNAMPYLEMFEAALQKPVKQFSEQV